MSSTISSRGSTSFSNNATFFDWQDNYTLQQNFQQLSTPESLMDAPSSSFPWILHHVLEKECADELPLRIMFTFNAGQQLPTLKQAHKWWQHEPKGKLIIQFLSSLPPSPRNEAPPVKEPKENSRKLERITEVTESTEEDEGDISPRAPARTSARNSARTSAISGFDRFMDSNHELLFDVSMAEDPLSSAHGPGLGRRTAGFPTQFIRNVCLNKVFLEDYSKADFTQALTCLDYLRDLECTRRTALREAALRLGINKNNWKSILNDEPEAYRWVSSVQKQELAIESNFAACFVDLRIWTMAHELQSEPFYKPNVLAMLNTLFPPAMAEMPNDKVDIKILHKYRVTFYQHILAVEARGTGIVKDFIEKLLEPTAKHGWVETRRHLEEYMSLADIMISEAKAVEGIEYYHETASSRHSRTISAARSSYSDRPQTASSANTSVDGWPQTATFLAPNSPEEPRKLATGIIFEKEIFDKPPPPPVSSKTHSPLSFRERANNSSGLKPTNSIKNRKSTPAKPPPPSITIPPADEYAPGPKTSPLLRRLSSPTAPGFLRPDLPRQEPEYIEEPATKKSGFDFLTRPWHVPSHYEGNDEPKRKKSLTNFLGLRRKASVVGPGTRAGSMSAMSGAPMSTVGPPITASALASSSATNRPKITHSRSSSEVLGGSGSPNGGRQRADSNLASPSAPDMRRLAGKKSLPDFSQMIVPPGSSDSNSGSNSGSGSRLSGGSSRGGPNTNQNGNSLPLPPLPPLPMNNHGRTVLPRTPEEDSDSYSPHQQIPQREPLKFDDAGFAVIDLDVRSSALPPPPPSKSHSPKLSPTSLPLPPPKSFPPNKSPHLSPSLSPHSLPATPNSAGGMSIASSGSNKSCHSMFSPVFYDRTSMRASAAPAPLHIKKRDEWNREEWKQDGGRRDSTKRGGIDMDREMERERVEMEIQAERDSEFDRPRTAPKPPEVTTKTVHLDLGRFARKASLF